MSRTLTTAPVIKGGTEYYIIINSNTSIVHKRSAGNCVSVPLIRYFVELLTLSWMQGSVGSPITKHSKSFQWFSIKTLKQNILKHYTTHSNRGANFTQKNTHHHFKFPLEVLYRPSHPPRGDWGGVSIPLYKMKMVLPVYTVNYLNVRYLCYALSISLYTFHLGNRFHETRVTCLSDCSWGRIFHHLCW